MYCHNNNNSEFNLRRNLKNKDLYFAELHTEIPKVQTSCTLISPYIVKIVPFGFVLVTVKHPAFKRDTHSIKLIRHECLNVKDITHNPF